MVLRRIAGSNSPAVRHDAPARIDVGADPRDRGVHHPPPVLDRAHLAHLQVLRGRGREPVRRVVHGHDQEPGPVAHEGARGHRGSCSRSRSASPNAGTPRRVERVHALPRRAVDRDLLDRPEPRQLVAERHVLAERHEVHLVVPADRDPVPVVQDAHARALAPVGVVVHGADDRRGADGRDRLADPSASRRRVGRGRRGRALPRPRRPGRAGRPRSVSCSAMFRPATPRSSPADEAWAASRTSTWIVATSTAGPVGVANGISEPARGRSRRRAPPARVATRRPPPADRGDEESVHGHHRERHAPHAGDGRERDRTAGCRPARRPRSPGEAAERPEAPHPVEERPQGGRAERGATGRPGAADGRIQQRRTAASESATRQRERHPGQLAEAPDPVDRGAVAAEAEHEPEERSARTARTGRRATGAARSRRTPRATRPPAGRRADRARPAAKEIERRAEGRVAPSGAVPAPHPLLVRQLAAVLDEEAVRADELGRPGSGRRGCRRARPLVPRG